MCTYIYISLFIHLFTFTYIDFCSIGTRNFGGITRRSHDKAMTMSATDRLHALLFDGSQHLGSDDQQLLGIA